MNNNVIVALDQGSSGTRVFAVDGSGAVLYKRAETLAPAHPQEGYAQYNAEELLESQIPLLNEMLDKLEEEEVSAIAVSSQRSTVVLWNRRTGKALAPVLSWQDGRAAQEAQGVLTPQQDIHRLTGLYKTPFYSAPKIAWCLKHIPAVRRAAKAGDLAVGPVATYLIWHLTKSAVFAVDPTLAQRTLLYNIHTGDWDDDLLNAFGINRACLPEIRPTAGDYGLYEYRERRIPILVCVGDQQAFMAGMGLHAGSSSINYGTGAFFLHNAGKELKQIPGILTSVSASGTNGKCDFILEGPVNACGVAFDWLKQLGFTFEMDELDDLCAQAQRPVWFLPALGGLGAPYWDFNASAVLAGFSPQTKRADMVAGVLRGVAFLVADIAYYIKNYGVDLGPITVAGGLANHAALLQFQADILQTDLHKSPETESTVMGAAYLAAQALNIDTSAWALFQKGQAVKPAIKPEEAELLNRQWRNFLEWSRTQKK